MQISSLIIAPAFMAAGNYILLGRIIPVLGSKYSFIHPLSYTIVFVIGDLISLVIQAIGGGQASAAETLEGGSRDRFPLDFELMVRQTPTPEQRSWSVVSCSKWVSRHATL